MDQQELFDFPLFDREAIAKGGKVAASVPAPGGGIKALQSIKPAFTDAEEKYFYDETFTEESLDTDFMVGASYESCVFSHCQFNKTCFNKTTFQDCTFQNCQILLTKMENTSLQNVRFVNCKLLGITFSECNQFSFSLDFRECLLDTVVFYGDNLKRVPFYNCQIRNSDFTGCNLSEASFDGSRFQETIFSDCQMDKADFTAATGYSIDPYSNKIKGAKFSLPDAQSFLPFLGIIIE